MPFLKKKLKYTYIITRLFSPMYLRTFHKRVYLSAFVSGSLTIEAALILPLLTFFTIIMCSPLFIMSTELILRDKMVNCAFKLSEYSFVLEKAENSDFLKNNDELGNLVTNSLSVVYARSYILDDDFSTHLDKSIVFDDNSISFKYSSISVEEDFIDLVADYEVTIHLPLELPYLHLAQRCYVRSFTGISITDSAYEPVRVYITKYGTAYHKTKECSYLYNMNFINIPWDDYDSHTDDIQYMNLTYKSCSRCQSLYEYSKSGYIYLSIGAYAYHYSLECPTLTRTVYSVSPDQISDDYSPCYLCY